MEWSAINAIVGVVGVAGVVFSYSVLKPLNTSISSLIAAIENLRASLDRTEQKRQDMDKRLVAVEESVKSAHHRIDGIGKGV